MSEQTIYKDDEIDFKKLWLILKKRIWLILSVTLLSTMASAIYAINSPNIYSAQMTLMPSESAAGLSQSSLGGQIGGLASLAGINLGRGNSADKSVMALELMKSWDFTEQFINKYGIKHLIVAAESWDKRSKSFTFDTEVFDEVNNNWAKNEYGNSMEPDSWVAYRKFQSFLEITQDNATGFVNVSLDYYSPEHSVIWLKSFVKELNDYVKQLDIRESEKNINFLQQKIKQTQNSQLHSVFYQLIEQQTKKQMLATVSHEYVFKTLNSPRSSERAVEPKRKLIIMIGGILGVFISFVLVIVLAIKNQEF